MNLTEQVLPSIIDRMETPYRNIQLTPMRDKLAGINAGNPKSLHEILAVSREMSKEAGLGGFLKSIFARQLTESALGSASSILPSLRATQMGLLERMKPLEMLRAKGPMPAAQFEELTGLKSLEEKIRSQQKGILGRVEEAMKPGEKRWVLGGPRPWQPAAQAELAQLSVPPSMPKASILDELGNVVRGTKSPAEAFPGITKAVGEHGTKFLDWVKGLPPGLQAVFPALALGAGAALPFALRGGGGALGRMAGKKWVLPAAAGAGGLLLGKALSD